MTQKNRSKTTVEASASAPLKRRVALLALCVVVGSTCTVVAYSKLRKFVDNKYATTNQAPTVVLKNRPAWMKDDLAEKICRTASPGAGSSVFDTRPLMDVRDQLTSDPDVAPWIESIGQIRRTYTKQPGDTIEVEATFRSPLALVRTASASNEFWMVDSTGVVLKQISPEQVPQTLLGPDGKPALWLVEGVRSAIPSPGIHWKARDLQAGLELLRLLHDRPVASEFTKVDVSNFGGIKDQTAAQLVLITRYNTEVRWGRPVSSKDYFVEVSAARKLQYLDQIKAQFGQVDARRQWIDIRSDRPMTPKSENSAAPNAPSMAVGPSSNIPATR